MKPHPYAFTYEDQKIFDIVRTTPIPLKPEIFDALFELMGRIPSESGINNIKYQGRCYVRGNI